MREKFNHAGVDDANFWGDLLRHFSFDEHSIACACLPDERLVTFIIESRLTGNNKNAP